MTIERVSTIAPHDATSDGKLLPLAMRAAACAQVEPRGWLREQLKRMAEGMHGRLEELSSFVEPNNGWLGGEGVAWEEQPYWARGLYEMGSLLGDEKALAISRRYIETAIASVQPDGWYGPEKLKGVITAKGVPIDDVWPHMVMNDMLLSYYQDTGDARIPKLLLGFFRYCLNIPEERFLPDWPREEIGAWQLRVQVERSGDMIPQIHELYRLTGEEWLLKVAERFFRHILPNDSEHLAGHVVNFTQRYRYAASYYPQSKESWHWDSAEYYYRQHHALWGQQPRGIFGADENVRPGKVDPRQGFETCAMAEYARSFSVLAGISGEAKFAQRTEDIMLNHFPASHDPWLKGLHYLTAANQPVLDRAPHDYDNTRNGVCNMIYYSPHIYRCCQHNAASGWPIYVRNLFQRTADGGVCVWMYAPARLKDTLTVETDYPFETSARVTVEKAGRYPLYLRIPEWSRGCEVGIEGKRLALDASAKGYVRAERDWKAGDVVEIRFVAQVSIKRWPRNGSATVDWGALSFTPRIGEEWTRIGGTEEWPEWEVHPTTPWNYALVPPIDPAAIAPEHARVAGEGEQVFTPENAPVKLKMRARLAPDWRLSDEGAIPELPFSPVATDAPEEEIEMIPLGCARLRVGCMPVADAE